MQHTHETVRTKLDNTTKVCNPTRQKHLKLIRVKFANECWSLENGRASHILPFDIYHLAAIYNVIFLMFFSNYNWSLDKFS